MDPLLVGASALLFGAFAVVAPWPAALAALALLVLLWRRSRWTALCGVLLFALSALRAQLAVDGFEARRVQLRDALGPPARCAARARIVSSPTVQGGVPGYLAELTQIDCEGRQLPPARARLYGGPHDLRRGDQLFVVAQLAPVRLFDNLELPDPRPRAARRGALLSGMALSVELSERGWGLGSWIDAARAHVRRRIHGSFAPAVEPMARALVLGENDLDPDDDAAFRKSGLSHMLAVSGTHLVFAVVLLVQALTFVLLRVEALAARWEARRLAAALGAVLALLYADFAGGSGSAWRAAWMLAAGLGVLALGRRPNAARSVAVSLGVGALVDPLMAFDISFLLSAAATSGLVLIGRPWAARIERIGFRPLRYLVLSVAATLASMLPCAPLLALLSPELTLAGIVANVIASPFGELVALPVCLVHTLLAPLPSVERGAALVASGALLVVKHVARASAATTWLAFEVPSPSGLQVAVLALAGVAWWRVSGVRRRALLALGALGLLWGVERGMLWRAQPRGELRVSLLDVGQGDSALVDLPDGRLMLIDGGGFVGSPVDPGRSVILPLLRERRRKRVDIAVLSHPHPDHFTGLATTLASVEVGELWDTGQGEREGAGPLYRDMLADLRRRGVKVRRPAELCGEHQFGGAVVEVLAPCPSFVPRRDANDNSLVLRIRLGRRAVLFTGDAEREEEAELLAHQRSRLRADLLKTGHHGSRTSTSPEFLRAVNPSLATISCGVRNRYGHPHQQTLDTLAAARVPAARLDRTGGVEWRSDGDEVWLRLTHPPR